MQAFFPNRPRVLQYTPGKLKLHLQMNNIAELHLRLRECLDPDHTISRWWSIKTLEYLTISSNSLSTMNIYYSRSPNKQWPLLWLMIMKMRWSHQLHNPRRHKRLRCLDQRFKLTPQPSRLNWVQNSKGGHIITIQEDPRESIANLNWCKRATCSIWTKSRRPRERLCRICIRTKSLKSHFRKEITLVIRFLLPSSEVLKERLLSQTSSRVMINVKI